MAAGAILVIIATFMQCFAPRGNIGVFIAGRVVIGLGQGLALSMRTWSFRETIITNATQLRVLSTLENCHVPKYEAPSCHSGRCSTPLAHSLRAYHTFKLFLI